ncbi:serine protease [Streptomyces sp. NPDC048389]|uniref:serine protease n=1 Tax=Streptomyces sp. NPDC048389 TaxID=3154622 RepID=UPI0034546BB2
MGRADLAGLVRICDPAGRPYGTGFVADDIGTVVTGHHVIHGLPRPLLLPLDGDEPPVQADTVTPLPGSGLALVHANGLRLPPLPIGAREHVEPGTYVRIAAGGWREARVLATDRGVLELAIGTDGSDALRPGGTATGGPVLDAATGAVLAVLAAPPPPGTPTAVLARLLGTAGSEAHAALLRRNAATTPAYGQDLNLAAVLELTAVTHGLPGAPGGDRPPPVRRPEVERQFADFIERAGTAPVLGLVGAPGTGRTTELRALAARRAHGPEPAPTLRLRGADLRAGDASVADAVARGLREAARILGVPEQPVCPDLVARLAAEAGRPLLVVLDGLEEAAPAVARALPRWTPATAEWLLSTRTALVVSCRPEQWDEAGALYPPGVLHRPVTLTDSGPRPRVPESVGNQAAGPLPSPGGGPGLAEAVRAAGGGAPRGRAAGPSSPPALCLGDLTAEQARLARERYGLGPGAVAAVDERYPLVLRLLAEVRGAVPGAPAGRPGRQDVYGAYLDLICLRIAVRITTGTGRLPRGTAVRRLAAAVAGRTHEAARRCLGPGHGQLDRAAFEELFPWVGGWAHAVLTEGLLVPAGDGYRFAHEELSDWIQGGHLDLDAALRALADRAPGEDDPVVPRHRIGPVVHGLLLLGRDRGAHRLVPRLCGLVDVLDGPCGPEARWWASALLREVLGRVPDAEPYLAVLRRLAERPGGEYAPGFWARLPLGDPSRLDLLRRLVPTDPAPRPSATDAPAAPRYLELADERLTADPRAVQPLLCRWFDDETPLAAGPGAAVRPTVGGAAQALLYARRGLAPDHLTETLAAVPHPRAAELLRTLAEDEPSAMCRAVDRWARDPRPARRAAAAAHAPLIRPTEDADRGLLRRAALALLAGTRDAYGPALTVLVRDPVSRPRHLQRALGLVATGDPRLPVGALTDAVATHPGPVLAALRTRLLRPGPAADAEEIFATLAGADTTPATARRAAALVCEYVDHRPDGAAHAAAYVHHRLEHGPDGRDVLFPLVTHLVRGRPARVRSALAHVLAAPGSPASRPLRAELLDVLLRYEQYEARDLAVLDALLHAAAHGSGVQDEERTRALVRRTGLLLVRTAKGAACFDRRLTELTRDVSAFAALMARWPVTDPQEWTVVTACRSLATGAGPVPMPTGSVGHGSLRPA